MSKTSIELEGVDRLIRKLNHADFRGAIVTGISWGMDRVQKELMEYPPETYRNRPHQVTLPDGSLSAVRWYERDVGQHVRDRLYRTSEKLKKKWSQKLYQTKSKIIGYLKNTASYSVWVHGDRKTGEKGQTDLMKEIGWPVGGDIARKFAPKINKVILDKFEKDWRRSR